MNSNNIETLSFEEILEQEDYVICDAALTGPPRIEWYWDGIYGTRRFSNLDSEHLKKEIETLESFLGLLNNRKVHTTKGFSSEAERIRDLIGGNIKFLRGIERIGKKERKYDDENAGERLLVEVHDMLHEVYRKSKRICFSPGERGKYDLLERIVLEVTEKTGAKMGNDEIYDFMNFRKKPKKTIDFHTGEQIVATALYLSSAEGQRGGILTINSAIKRILQNTIGSGKLNGISDLVARNRIRIYFVSGTGEAQYCFDTTENKSKYRR